MALRSRGGTVAVVLGLATLCALPLASAELRRADNRRVSVRLYSGAGTVEEDRMAFLWERHLPANGVVFTLEAMCTRANTAPFGFVGDNRIAYRDVMMKGQDSGNEVSLEGQTMRLTNGGAPNLLWDVTSEVGNLFSGDSRVEISGTVDWMGDVAAGDVLSCTLRILEGSRI